MSMDLFDGFTSMALEIGATILLFVIVLAGFGITLLALFFIAVTIRWAVRQIRSKGLRHAGTLHAQHAGMYGLVREVPENDAASRG